MVRYTSTLPRLSRLRMFEAAARSKSFTLAANELGVTQAAVSQQVRSLEQELGVKLFERRHRGLALTAPGQRFFRVIAMAFGEIADAADELRAERRPAAISIGATFAVATFWLIPRLPKFRALHPDLTVHVIATDRGFDEVTDKVDVGIAYGDGSWPGFSSTLVRESTVFPVCSPAYAAAHPGLDGLDALIGATLLSLEDDRPGRLDWPAWFAALDVDSSRIVRNLKFNSHPLLMQAACEGQGVALGWDLLTDDLIAGGKLIRPIKESVQTAKGFYLVDGQGAAHRQNSSDEAVEAFKAWIIDEIKPKSH